MAEFLGEEILGEVQPFLGFYGYFSPGGSLVGVKWANGEAGGISAGGISCRCGRIMRMPLPAELAGGFCGMSFLKTWILLFAETNS